MRIIAGKYGGRRLDVPRGNDVRPTTDRVRESLFSSLSRYLSGARVLDLFGGSGSLGLESLSRGAASVTFVEKSRKTAGVLKKNLSSLGLDDGVSLHCSCSIKWLERQVVGSAGYDLIFLDPPYAGTLLEQAMELVARKNMLNHDGLIIAEYPSADDLKTPATLRLVKTKKYGNTCVAWLEVNPASDDIEPEKVEETT